jgi:4'-phosphopantetheinyl transferase
MDNMEPSAIGQVDVWIVNLDLRAGALPALMRVLAPDEMERANHFRFERDVRRFVVTRAALRRLLGMYIDQDAGAIQFKYGAYGKPSLATRSVVPPLYFNVSHSEDLALVAVSRSYEVGVDVERIQNDFPIDEVTPMVFGPAEVQLLHSLAPIPRRQRFYTFWTRKEAYIKALGWGLSFDPARVDVSSGGEVAAADFHVLVDGVADTDGYLVDLTVATGFASTLAAIGGPAQIILRHLLFP